MAIYENGKRVASRAIVFIDNKILLMERHRKVNDEMLHYFTVPGGGVEEGESYREAAIREMKEETCCDIKILKDLIREDYGEGICYWFYAKCISGIPTLGGEEKEHNSEDNNYQVVLIDINIIDNINIPGMGKQLIKECYKMYIE